MDLPSSQPWIELARCLLGFLAFLVPVGLALLKLTRRPVGPGELGLALALGYAVVCPLVLAEAHVGLPILVLPVVLASALAVGRDWHAFLGRRLALELALPLALLAWAAWANAGDVTTGAAGVTFRAGSDVSDRLIYALVAQQSQAAPPPATQHPLFAGLPFPYSYFPAMAGSLLQRYAGVSLLSVFVLHLPALGLLLTALLADACLREAGVESRPARALAALLVALGGDLGWLLPLPQATALERTQGSYVFFMASGDWLLFNSWMLGVPLSLAVLLAMGRWLRGGGWVDLLAVALLGGALLQTKLFAFVPLAAGAFVAGLVARRPRLLAAGAALVAGGLPWAALIAASGGGGQFLLWPLAHVRRMLVLSPGLQPLARLALTDEGLLLRLAAWAVALGLFVLGGLGGRLAGLPALARAARSDASGWHACAAAALLVALVLGHTAGAWPLPADGAQFFMLAAVLAGLFSGPALAASLRSRRTRPAGVAALALTLVGPLGYVALKKFPEALTRPGALDRARLSVSWEGVSACGFLRARSRPTDRLLAPLDAPGGLEGGFQVAHLAALSGRPLVAGEFPFNLEPQLVTDRLADVRAFYATADAEAAEAFLERFAVRWVWEDRRSLLRFRSPRLRPVFWNAEVRISEFR